MQMWADVQLGLATTRRQELEAEAAATRLAAIAARSSGAAGLRGGVGRALIRAGRAIAGEPMAAHARGRLIARQP